MGWDRGLEKHKLMPMPGHAPGHTLQGKALTQLQENDGGISAQGVGSHTLSTGLQQLWSHKDIQDAQDTLWTLVLLACLQGRSSRSGAGGVQRRQ